MRFFVASFSPSKQTPKVILSVKYNRFIIYYLTIIQRSLASVIGSFLNPIADKCKIFDIASKKTRIPETTISVGFQLCPGLVMGAGITIKTTLNIRREHTIA